MLHENQYHEIMYMLSMGAYTVEDISMAHQIILGFSQIILGANVGGCRDYSK